MTTIAEGTLTDALQALVDARLDTIDRMLLGRVNRHDRLAIVREVESQVFDLLRRHEGGPIDRDDVLAVLARLDPPEAYLPEEGSTAEARPRQASVGPRAFPNPGDAQPSRLDLAGGVLGLVSLSVLLLGVLLVLMNLDEIVFLGSPVLGFVPSLLAIIFAVKAGLRTGWAIVGLVTGLLSLLACLAAGGYILTELF